MLKRMVLLLVVAIVVAGAPEALASHCLRCAPPQARCVTAVIPNGYATCEWDVFENTCYLADPCGPHGGFTAPLADEFQVAAVERLDDGPQSNPTEIRVASLEPAPSANR